MPEDKKPEITVEQLLRLKRAEKPSEEFWQKFEADFQRRRLQALVHRESWWHRLADPVLRFSYAAVPVGVTAALAVGFMALQSARNPEHPSVPGLPPMHPASSVTAALDAPAGTSSELSLVVSTANTFLDDWQISGRVDSRFVMDSLPVVQDNAQRFRTVRHTPMIRLSTSGQTRYVADPLTSGASATFVPASVSSPNHF